MAKSKSFADDGWALWIDGNDISTVYLNEWLDPSGRSYTDFGLHIRGIQESHMVSVYIPFPIGHDKIEDISLQYQDEKLLYAMLNAACIIDFKKNDYTSEIAYNGKTADFVHISALGFDTEPVAEGTLLTIPLDILQPYLANDEAFIRFRVPHKSLDHIFAPDIDVTTTLTRIRDLVTSPLVAERYGHSVRINEIRMLPSDIIRIGALHRQKLKKAVVTICIAADYEISDANCYRIRRLEEDLYRGYAPPGYDCSNAIIYQWNATRETHLNGHFNFYFNISRNTVSRTSMLIYMILLLLVGAGGNALWTLISFLFSLL